MNVREELLKTPDLRNLLDDLEKVWREEQVSRHTFWADADENVKAEFILGEIVYHSPIYGRHLMAPSNILTALLPFVKNNNSGKVGVEKVMVRLTRNNYKPDICFGRQKLQKLSRNYSQHFHRPNLSSRYFQKVRQRGDYGIKMTDYALHGVKEYWIVDPESNSVEQYLLQHTEFQLDQKLKEGMLKSEVISGFEIEVQRIFEA